MEKWTEIIRGFEPDGFPKFAYIHNSCGKLSLAATQFCQRCGKRITHMDITPCGGLEIASMVTCKDRFVCEILQEDND